MKRSVWETYEMFWSAPKVFSKN